MAGHNISIMNHIIIPYYPYWKMISYIFFQPNSLGKGLSFWKKTSTYCWFFSQLLLMEEAGFHTSQVVQDFFHQQHVSLTRSASLSTPTWLRPFTRHLGSGNETGHPGFLMNAHHDTRSPGRSSPHKKPHPWRIIPWLGSVVNNYD